MTLVKWTPITRRPAFNLFNEFNRMIDHMPAHHEDTVSAYPSWTPSLDVREDKSGYTISVDLPGMEKKDIDISIDEGVLSISGERKHEINEEDNGWIRNEVSYGKFRRSFTLTDDVDQDSIKASFKNGVLIVGLAKIEPVKREVKQIAIK